MNKVIFSKLLIYKLKILFQGVRDNCIIALHTFKFVNKGFLREIVEI